jgi:hypothetical protein
MERSKRRRACPLLKQQERQLMKFTTMALATAFTLTSTFALAQAPGLGGYGTVTAPSVGSYTAPVGTTNAVPTWQNTGPAAPLPSSPTFAPMPVPSQAPTVRASGVRR